MISEKPCFTSNESFMHILEMIPALTPEQEIKDLYIELLAVIKKIMPDTGLTNKEELVNNCLENPELADLNNLVITSVKIISLEP